jgi:ABC-type nitrate/sulfonate/bicarbonate transport system substrate-binding protein
VHIAPYAGNAAWLDANPNTAKAFVAAMRKAVEYMRANPAEAKGLIAGYTGAKPELVDAVPIDEWSTSLSVDNVAQTLAIMKQEGVLKKDLDARAMLYDVK